jgi:tRNA dimethylallyltransferase
LDNNSKTLKPKNIIVVVGPTGVGKSRLAISIAQHFNGEIVNADSRQIYRMMDIGTAKPDAREMSLVPHHLFDIINPDQDYSLAQYQDEANRTIREILGRSKLPVLVGGSGQYIIGLLEGWQIPRIAPDPELRRGLEEKAKSDPEVLVRQLQELDPQAAQQIDSRNLRRVIRALEVCLQSGKRFSELRTKNPSEYRPLWIGLTMARPALYKRTDERVRMMFSQGLIKETQCLIEKGYSPELPAMSSIGYPQGAAVIAGEMTEEEAIIQVQHETHRYIRHQYAWFRLKDTRIKWFDNEKEVWPLIATSVREFLATERGTSHN